MARLDDDAPITYDEDDLHYDDKRQDEQDDELL